ncbi:MAG TPA: amino acid transport protein [Verrucomicrobiae bacterium]|nr:amino acid transport protein [Verrucomicrobiae bacterium]
MGNPAAMVASFVWSTIGMGFAIYGKKQQAALPLCGGMALMLIPFFCSDSALIMSLISIAVIAGIIWLRKYV